VPIHGFRNLNFLSTESIVTSGLIANLDAGNSTSYPGSGTTWFDLSGNANNGTLVNGVGYSSSNRGTLTFDGVNDYVNMGDKFSINEGSIDIWFNSNVTINSSTTIDYRLFGKTNNMEARLSVGSGTPGNLRLDWGQTSDNLISTQNVWNSGTWYNIVFTWKVSSNNSELYVQSILDGTGTAGTISAEIGNFSLGAARATPQGFINGNIATFKVYSIQLSSSQVLQNFNALRGRYGI
jgi:hypothetical protein